MTNDFCSGGLSYFVVLDFRALNSPQSDRPHVLLPVKLNGQSTFK